MTVIRFTMFFLLFFASFFALYWASARANFFVMHGIAEIKTALISIAASLSAAVMLALILLADNTGR